MSKADHKSEPRQSNSMQAELLAAIDRVCRTDGGASITAVAKEVGVTPALIYNRYPDVASAIRSLTGRHKRDNNAALKSSLEEQRTRCSQLRAINDTLYAELRTLASVNEGLRRQLTIEQARCAAQVVALPRRRPIAE